VDGGNPLVVEHLSVAYGGREVVHDVSLHVAAGETVGLVGGSGSGKSTIAAAAATLLPPAGRVSAGRILVDGHDVTSLDAAGLRAVRGRTVAFVPQDAMSALNPVHTIRSQIAEAVAAHERIDPAAARARADVLLVDVGLDPARGGDHPHQLSGGMRQRVVIAIALAADPAVLVADEPTSGLDVWPRTRCSTCSRPCPRGGGSRCSSSPTTCPPWPASRSGSGWWTAAGSSRSGIPGGWSTPPRIPARVPWSPRSRGCPSR
jgi:ABC-type glutathione transport system ATPase component